MNVTPTILRGLTKLNLTAEQMNGVLELIADHAEQQAGTKATKTNTNKAEKTPADIAFSIFCQEVGGSGISIPRKLTPDRRAAILQRLRNYSIEEWREACQKLSASSFCRGENDRGWKADFNFLCSPRGFSNVLEGRYDDREGRQAAVLSQPSVSAEEHEKYLRSDFYG